MHLPRYLRILPLLLLTSLLFACGAKPVQSSKYVALNNRDTAHLELTFYKDNFHGKLNILRAGNVVDSGTVEGNIHQDTLLGSFYYKPYGAKFKKRRAFVLLNKQDSLIQGSGSELVYMGIPYYIPTSITFDSIGYVFKEQKEL